MTACITLHNMIVEDEWENHDLDTLFSCEEIQPSISETGEVVLLDELIRRKHSLQDCQVHLQIRNDFIAHIWKKCGNDDDEEN